MAVLIEDTRQQAGKHAAKGLWWAEHGVAVHRSKLAVGDYALPPAVAVDTKKDVYELCADIDQQHERFKREQMLARDMGTRLVVLVENEDGVDGLDALAAWRESTRHLDMRVAALKKAGRSTTRVRRLDGRRFAKACETMAGRYGTVFMFCAPGEAAERICEILGVEYEQQ